MIDFTKEKLLTLNELEEEIIISQVELPDDFRRILNQNMWELLDE